MHVEWISATANPAELIEDSEDFQDDFGQTLDEGELGLYVGDGGGSAVVCGTQRELLDWLEHAQAVVADSRRAF